MGFLHAIQGVLVLWLSNGFTLPVVATYMTGPPGLEPPQVEPLFSVSIAWGVAGFLFLSALAHFVISAPTVYEWYLRNLAQKRNFARWIEYSLSSSVMVVLIAMLVGIADIAVATTPCGWMDDELAWHGLLMDHRRMGHR
jgi:hypothetical protein